MKFLAKVGSLALVAACAGGVIAGCSSTQSGSQGSAAKNEGPTGTIGLALQPVSGVTLNKVHYIVTKGGVTVSEGDLPTPGTAKTFAFGLPLPVGTGYSLSLSAVSNENNAVTCVGSVASFDILPNQSTQLSTALVCSDATNGSVSGNVNVTTEACPRLAVDFVVASPSAANSPSGTIAVAGSAHDLDGKAISYAWTVSDTAVGSFAPANAASATFTCLTSSATAVTIKLTANNTECSKSLTTQVSCTSLTCGDGTHNPGEACDLSAGDLNCNADCTVPVCGDGKIGGTEKCDPVPADPANCTATCQIKTAVCGDNLLTLGEPCDGALVPAGTPAGGTCNATCTVYTPPAAQDVCNDGTVGPTEVCDVPFTVNNCGKACKGITPAACFTCENDPGTCQDFVSCDIATGNAAAGSPAAGTPKAALCNEVLDCVRTTGCAAGGAAPINCYCGTASGADCQAGLGNGACKTQIERGLETTAFTSISARFKNTGFGGGVALARIDCDQNACPAACGL